MLPSGKKNNACEVFSGALSQDSEGPETKEKDSRPRRSSIEGVDKCEKKVEEDRAREKK